MSGKLFHLTPTGVIELAGSRYPIERELQRLLEQHLEIFLGVRFVASEHPTGARHGGRIDTLGIDENNVPVIIEYKREVHDSVINQGLFYLDWLVNSKAEFRLLVQDRLGTEAAAAIDWASPRLICIAGDFTRYDTYAVQQINRSIELVRYRRYGHEHLMLELANTPLTVATPTARVVPPVPLAVSDADGTVPGITVTAETTLQKASSDVIERYRLLTEYLLGLGDDVQIKTSKLYFAFKRLKNFVTVVPSRSELMLNLKLDPRSVTLEAGFTRDVRTISHWGTGDLELIIRTDDDLEKAKPLLLRSYEQS